MHGMFEFATSFKGGNLSKWDVSTVTDMTDMFSYAASFIGDLRKWQVAGSTLTDGMFFRDACAACEYLPPTLTQPCFSQCTSSCDKTLSASACDHQAECTWCKSDDQLHQHCFIKFKTPTSGWLCDGSNAAAVSDGNASSLPVIQV